MKNLIKNVLPICLILSIISCQQTPDRSIPQIRQITNKVDNITWETGNWRIDLPVGEAGRSRGYHRAVIKTEETAPAVYTRIPWRRHDYNPAAKDLILVNAETDLEVKNLHILKMDNENGHIIFQPETGSDTYHLYYFPYETTGSYYPKVSYLKPEIRSEKSWLRRFKDMSLADSQKLPPANVTTIQAMTDFHSFFPMEVAAAKSEVQELLQRNPRPYYLFPEYRENPIRMRTHLPRHWTTQNLKDTLSAAAKRGEYFTFQVGVYSPGQDMGKLEVSCSGLSGEPGTIPSDQITCINTGGIDLLGKPFTKTVSVKKGDIQPLWFGVQIDPGQKPGQYAGQVTINPGNSNPQSVHLKLTVAKDKIANYGDDRPKNMTRLRWLNSTIGSDPDFIMAPYMPIEIDGHTLKILGRDITVETEGLPSLLCTYFTAEMTGLTETPNDILTRPMEFNITKNGKQEIWKSKPFKIRQENKGKATWKAESESENFRMTVDGTLEYEGMLNYRISLIPKNNINVDDIVLNIPMRAEAAAYILGLGFKGQKRPEQVDWKWDITRHQEGVWLGGINRGLQYVLRDDNYERPLNTNFYQQKPLNMPPSWFNDGKGGIKIKTTEQEVTAVNYSGPRSMKKGDTLHFNIRFLITPFKYIDTKAHFNTRFVHKYVPVDSVKAWGGTVVNIHHANEINPFINYPFHNLGKQSAYIEEAHRKGIKVKLYYTIRELTYKCYEIFALRSLGDEIFNDGEGGGHPWLQEHLQDRYHSAWHAWRVDDAAILNKGTSRWTNYYIEGLNWLAKNQKIDGLYLDDIAFSRETVKRMVFVLNQHRDDVVIDLHSANQYNPRDGFINSAFLYMEHFPFINRLWFGEYFDYNANEDFYLTEVSGIPFGLMGEMLQDGGHPYRGMLYGMTTRLYGKFNPGPVWRMWDEFKIDQSRMIGYWVNDRPVKTDNEGILATTYINKNAVLISLASWADRDVKLKLNLDWQKLGMNRDKVSMFAPEVAGLQEYQELNPEEGITVPADRGLFVIVEKK